MNGLRLEKPLSFFLMNKTKFKLQMIFALENCAKETTSVNEQYPLLSQLPIYMQIKMEDVNLNHPLLISSMED